MIPLPSVIPLRLLVLLHSGIRVMHLLGYCFFQVFDKGLPSSCEPCPASPPHLLVILAAVVIDSFPLAVCFRTEGAGVSNSIEWIRCWRLRRWLVRPLLLLLLLLF